MFKKIFTPIFVVLIAFVTTWGQNSSSSRVQSSSSRIQSSSSQQQKAAQVELDVIIRDFPLIYPGFQEYDYNKTDNSQTDPKQCNTSASKGMVQDTLDYSKCSADERKGADYIERSVNGRYCARPMPVPADQAPSKMCYGENLQSWFTDGTHTKTFKELMTLTRRADGLYEIEYNTNTRTDWNGYGTSAGYFPLDKYDNKNSPDYSPGATFGMQNLGGRDTYCDSKIKGRDENCAKDSAQAHPSVRPDWHNFGFTVTGSAEFKYASGSGDKFVFTGDDDMWVFIDGVLALDLGGIHSALTDSFNIDVIARARGWEDGSLHSINFFYAERQTVESNLRLRFALTGLSEPRFGAPRILKALTTINEAGANETMIWVSTKLDLASIEKFISSDQFPIIIRKSDDKNVNGYKLSSIEFSEADGANGYIYVIKGDVCKGKDCTLTIGSGDSLSFNVKYDDLIDGGYLDGNSVTLPINGDWYVKSSIGIEATKVSLAPNTTKMPPVEFKPVPGDNNPVKPDFADIWFSGNPIDGSCDACGKLPTSGPFPNITQIWDPVEGKMVPAVSSTNTTVHGFGQKGTPIPPERAGELILTAFPNASGTVNTIKGTMSYADWKKDEELQKLFGLPPGVSDYGPYGTADPKKQATDGGYQFVKNGFPNESSAGGNGRIAPTRCIADRTKPDEPRINCLNFSLLAQQPFQLSVILYDQLGNFVTQYREKVTEREFRSVVQGPNYAEDKNIGMLLNNATPNCKKPESDNYGHPEVLTTNGLVKVNVNIYPFSRDGRRFGNGVYIAKIDRVDLPYDGCMNNEGMPTYINADYMRYHAEQKFGWMRANSPKK